MDIEVIWVRRETKYFCKDGWTGFSPTGKSVAQFATCSLPVIARSASDEAIQLFIRG
jgi:hypothetical protein